VEYCNQPGGSSLAEERAANGSAEPFRVRHWGIGNENWGCGGNMRPEHYSNVFRNFSVYVRNFGGTRPFLIASGPNGNDVQWTRGLLDGIRRGFPDGVAMHYYSTGLDAPTSYTPAHVNEQFSSFAKIEQAVVQQRAILNGYSSDSRISLLLDEWGVWDRIPKEDEQRYGRLWQQATIRSAVAAGLGLNLFNRQADKLHMCNIAQITNVLHALLLTDGPEGANCIRTTTYYAFALFKPHRGNTAVRVETDNASPLGISISASKLANTLVLTLVNPSLDADASVVCSLRASRAFGGSAQVLHDGDPNAANTFEQADRVVPKPLPIQVESDRVRLEVPRLSLATVMLSTAS
jgi:alpha-N-arabinofuranosidase